MISGRHDTTEDRADFVDVVLSVLARLAIVSACATVAAPLPVWLWFGVPPVMLVVNFAVTTVSVLAAFSTLYALARLARKHDHA
jgi:hydrogenase-4 membrane subunit HyfE